MSKYQKWLDAIANKETRGELGSSSSYALRAMGFKDPDDFLKLVRKAKKQSRRASDKILSFVISERGRVSSATLDNRVNAIKRFLEFYDLKDKISWGKIKVAKPKRRKVAGDRAPTKDEIRALLAECDSRMRFYVLACASSGARRGWCDYASVKDLSPVEHRGDNGMLKLGKLVVYRGEPEEYFSFISPEAWDAWLKYRKDRESVGEELKPDSPLIRDSWEKRFYLREKAEPWKAERIGSKSLGNTLLRLWCKAKAADPNSKGGYRVIKETNGQNNGDSFKAVHGFRKFFETSLIAANLHPKTIEALKGKKDSYNKSSETQLLAEYVKAIPNLTISEAEEVKHEKAKMEEQFLEIFKRLEERLDQIELDRLKEKLLGSNPDLPEVPRSPLPSTP